MMKYAVIIAGVLLSPSIAEAHHVVSTSGIAWVEPLNLAELEVTAAEFETTPELRGSWQTLAVRGEVALHERFSLSALVPWTHLRLSDGRGALGLGDVEASAKARLVDTEHGELILSTGFGIGLPTGDPTVGIGSGHVEFAPFVAASTHPVSWLIFDALVTQKWSVGGSSDATHDALVAPHADHETVIGTGSSLVWRAWYLRTSATAVVAHQSPMDGLDAGLDFGFAVPGRLRISLGGSLPVLGSRSFNWQSRLAAAVQFD